MQQIRDLSKRLRLMVGRAVVSGTNDGTKMQSLQVKALDGEVRDSAERFQNYGFTSHPKAGAEAAVMYVGGDRSHGLVVAVDDRRYRLKGLQGGEVAVYTDEGDKIVLGRNNTITVTTKNYVVNAETKITLNAPTVEVNGETFTANMSTSANLNAPQSNASGAVSAQGNISSQAQVSDANGTMQEMRDTYNSHKHTGVQAGGSTTGNPNQSMT